MRSGSGRCSTSSRGPTSSPGTRSRPPSTRSSRRCTSEPRCISSTASRSSSGRCGRAPRCGWLGRLRPPLTVGTESLALAAVLEPAYGVGGDAFDYAIGTNSAYFAIFDSSGHDLSAGLTASVALAAARTARREGLDLLGIAGRIDTSLTEQFADFRFITGVLARLDLVTGRLRYLVAGHPAPVLLRSGRAVRTLDGPQRTPFGRLASLAPHTAEPAEELLEPGDRLLLHSDGVVEARDADGA